MLELEAPLPRKVAEKLRAGQLVRLTGTLHTARDLAHRRANESGLGGLPKGFRGGVVYHCGPIVRKRGKIWQVVAAGPTTSARMDEALERFVKIAEPSAVVGKGGISKKAAGILATRGCPYLSMTGGTAALAASMVEGARGPYWRDLGDAEAVWELDVKSFGPLVVTVDLRGGDVYGDTIAAAEARAEKMLKRR